jgi:hypothetical protein
MASSMRNEIRGAGLDLELKFNLDNRGAKPERRESDGALANSGRVFAAVPFGARRATGEERTMKIDVLYFKGCPNFGPAIDVIRSVVPNATIDELEVTTAEDAERMQFLGSPTIRVDGIDIEPGARTRTDFALGCRTYGGMSVPSRELVQRAIVHNCCSRVRSAGSGSLVVAIGAAAFAVAASACCWLPFALLAFGISAFGLSAVIESHEYWLFAAAAVVLALGFYLAYGRAPRRSRSSKHLNRAVVWFAAACLSVSATFPFLAGIIAGAADRASCCSLVEADGTSAPQGPTGTVVDSNGARAERKPPTLTDISASFQELKDAFNANKNAVKVLLLVSPRCPMCRMGAVTVQKQLDRIQSDKVKVFVVWIKRFFGDSRNAAREAMALVPDRRARHFWEGSGQLSKRYAGIVELPHKRNFAWDVYFVFGPKAEWTESPPTPDFWMHQLGGPETGNLLDGNRFRDAIARRLP